MPKVTALQINGRKIAVNADAEQSLLSVLRDDMDLTGTKYGCGQARCGACTVLVDGVATRSCVTSVGTVVTRQITTIEGLEQNGKLHPLQEAFLEADALQCGYCTSGMIMSGVALLRKNSNPTVDEIVRAMDGNVCRCCVYPRIITAVTQAVKTMRESKA